MSPAGADTDSNVKAYVVDSNSLKQASGADFNVVAHVATVNSLEQASDAESNVVTDVNSSEQALDADSGVVAAVNSLDQASGANIKRRRRPFWRYGRRRHTACSLDKQSLGQTVLEVLWFVELKLQRTYLGAVYANHKTRLGR